MYYGLSLIDRADLKDCFIEQVNNVIEELNLTADSIVERRYTGDTFKVGYIHVESPETLLLLGDYGGESLGECRFAKFCAEYSIACINHGGNDSEWLFGMVAHALSGYYLSIYRNNRWMSGWLDEIVGRGRVSTYFNYANSYRDINSEFAYYHNKVKYHSLISISHNELKYLGDKDKIFECFKERLKKSLSEIKYVFYDGGTSEADS